MNLLRILSPFPVQIFSREIKNVKFEKFNGLNCDLFLVSYHQVINCNSFFFKKKCQIGHKEFVTKMHIGSRCQIWDKRLSQTSRNGLEVAKADQIADARLLIERQREMIRRA